MTQNIGIKSDTPRVLRKAMMPTGIVAVVLGLVWLLLYGFATTTWATNPEEVEKLVNGLYDASRYIAIVFIFVVLILSGLMITHSVFQFKKVNKATAKWEVTSAAINAVVGLLMFIFFIICVTKVFDDIKWNGTDIYKVFAFMGILTSLVIYTTIFGEKFNKKALDNKNTNIKMLRTLGAFVLTAAICSTLAVIFVLGGGFRDPKNFKDQGDLRNFILAAMSTKFALANFGVIAFALLLMIPCSLLGINDKPKAQKNVIMWSVLGGLTFILFIIGAAMMVLNKDGGPDKWADNHTTISVFVLLGWIASLVGGSLAFAKTKEYEPKIAKA